MNVFYIICAVFGTVSTIGLLVMLIGFNLKVNIGFSLPKGKTVPFERFVPQTIYGFAVFTAVVGFSGLIFSSAKLPVYFVIPVSVMTGMFVNFCGAHLFTPVFTKIITGNAPKPEDIEGYEAMATEYISGEGYGKVRVKYNKQYYKFDCISIYHTDIAKGEQVIIVTGEGELLFVQKADEIYNVLKES